MREEKELEEFKRWFEETFRTKIKHRPAMGQRELQQVAWLGWKARSEHNDNH